MNAREKLEAALEQAVDFLAYQATSGMTLGTQVAAAAALVQAGADIGLLDKTEAPKGNAGPLTDAELFGVDLSAEGKAYADLRPNECIGDYPPAKLPWRPIAELPKDHVVGRQCAFVNGPKGQVRVFEWDGGLWIGEYRCGPASVLSTYSHFLELTPP